MQSATTPQSILIKQGEAQTLTFYNSPEGGLELIKVNAYDKTKRIGNVTFEIRRMDGGLVETVTTGDHGRVHVNLDAGNYYAVEIEAAKGFKLDNTPHYFEIKDGETTTLTVANTPFSGIEIHKIDAVTREGIYGAKFLLYDAEKRPVGEYVTDQNGYIYIDDLTRDGKYFIRELECDGYNVDEQVKTINVKAGAIIQIEWENTPITGQIQITKYGYLLVANMSNALGEEDMVTARVVFHELWRMKMMEEALEYFFRFCMEYSVEVPGELIHTGIFGRAAATFAGELGAAYKRALIMYGIDPPI